MEEISAFRRALRADSGVIFANDGSTDARAQGFMTIRRSCPVVVVIEFAANAGQSALSAGFLQAAGEIIITPNTDLQYDPADIPSLLRWYRHYDVVTGRRARRRDSLVKRLSSRIANGTRNWLTESRSPTPAVRSRSSGRRSSSASGPSATCTGSCRRSVGWRGLRSARSRLATGRAPAAGATMAP